MRTKRRAGSIYRDRDRLVLALTVDTPDGPRRVRHATYPDTVAGRARAERDRKIMVGNDAAGGYQVPGQLTLGEYLEGWLSGLDYEVAAIRIRANTAATYATDLRAKVIPRLGGVALTDLSALMIRRLSADLLEKGGRRNKPLAPKTVRNVMTTLRRALADAVNDGLLLSNPADVVKLPRATRPRIETWSPSETRFFLDNLAEPLASMVKVTASTGMRRSELLGLRWRSVDLEAEILDVTAAVVMVGSEPTFVELTKTDSSRRRIALDPVTVSALRAHRVRQFEAKLQVGDVWSDELDLVFTDEIGRVFPPDRATRWFQREANRLGLSPVGWHGLRHSLATTALAEGVPVKVVSERLGHASVATTLDRYSHVTIEQDREAAVALATTIIGAGGS